MIRLYARYSTDKQSEASIDDQFHACRFYAASKGWTVGQCYEDEGISGAALGNRPGVQALLRDLQSGDVLLLTDLSRLARSQDLAPLVTRLRHRGVRVIGVQDGFDSDARTARMQAGLSGIMSEEFRAMVADRTRLALEQRARDGRSTGGKALADAGLVQEIFGRFAAGESMKAIASDLNARGVPSPGATWKREKRRKDGRWLVSTLHAILHNERYAGREVWNRSQWLRDPDTGKRTRVDRPESEWVVREVPRLVDEATWKRVQARFRQNTGRGGRRNYLLSGLLVCAECGAKLVVVGGTQRRYVCSSHHHGGPAACGNASTFPRQAAEEVILRPVMDDLLSPAAVEAGIRAMRETSRKARPDVDPQVAALERLVRDGVLSPEVAAPALAEARRKAQEAAGGEVVPMVRPPSPAAWRAAVEAMRDLLTGDDVAAARDALRELLGEIRCRPAGDFVVAELTARQVMLGTGTGIWIGSGGAMEICIPRRRGAN